MSDAERMIEWLIAIGRTLERIEALLIEQQPVSGTVERNTGVETLKMAANWPGKKKSKL
jgi:hypothetical protein